MGSSWVISGPSCGQLGHLGVILGLSCAISVLRLRKTDAASPILRHSHLADTRARVFAFLGATCGLLSPSWRHLETVLRHPRAILGHPGTILACFWPSWRHFGPSRRADRRRQSSFSKIRTSPTREHHSGVVSRLQLGPFWGHLRQSRGHLVHIDHLGVIMGLSDVISVLRLLKTDDA